MVCTQPVTIWTRNRSQTKNSKEYYNPYNMDLEDYNSKKISFTEKTGWLEGTIPCGKCMGCLLDRANEKATRVWCEMQQWETGCFITLTYNNENLPKNKQLDKEELKKFWKRLRHHYKGNMEWVNPKTGEISKPIRYFQCGEYGDKNKRPHYHACVFNWEPEDLEFYKENHQGDIIYKSKKLQKIWGKGFVTIGKLNYETACYTARYTSKKILKDNSKYKYKKWVELEKPETKWNEKKKRYITKTHKIWKDPNIVEEFTSQSLSGGLGIEYWINNKEMILRNQGILIKIKDKVKIKPIPRFFKKMWEKEDWEKYEKYKYDNKKKFENEKEKIIKQISINGTDEEKYKYHLKNINLSLMNKCKTLKRDNLI